MSEQQIGESLSQAGAGLVGCGCVMVIIPFILCLLLIVFGLLFG